MQPGASELLRQDFAHGDPKAAQEQREKTGSRSSAVGGGLWYLDLTGTYNQASAKFGEAVWSSLQMLDGVAMTKEFAEDRISAGQLCAKLLAAIEKSPSRKDLRELHSVVKDLAGPQLVDAATLGRLLQEKLDGDMKKAWDIALCMDPESPTLRPRWAAGAMVFLRPEDLQAHRATIQEMAVAWQPPRRGINRVFVSEEFKPWVYSVIMTKRRVEKRGHQEGKHKCVVNDSLSGLVPAPEPQSAPKTPMRWADMSSDDEDDEPLSVPVQCTWPPAATTAPAAPASDVWPALRTRALSLHFRKLLAVVEADRYYEHLEDAGLLAALEADYKGDHLSATGRSRADRANPNIPTDRPDEYMGYLFTHCVRANYAHSARELLLAGACKTVELERGRGPVEYAKEWEDLGYPECAELLRMAHVLDAGDSLARMILLGTGR
jgi:hypothetical protein